MSRPDAAVLIPNPDASIDVENIAENIVMEYVASYDENPRLSAWSMSTAKRVFDLVVVAACAPLILPLLFIVAAAVRLSSPGPVLFRQTRIGSGGRPFTILKFRTMFESDAETHGKIASISPERITPAGRILRKLKFDELPQFLNVLRGEMSLVGPRPRIAAQQLGIFFCRPGITGAATLAFAREEVLLARVPQKSLADFYRDSVLPAKHRLDSQYMARATMLSDLHVLLLTALGRWPVLRLPLERSITLRNSQSEVACGVDPA